MVKEEEKNIRTNFFGGSLKNLYEDKNPVIFNNNLQTNALNDNIKMKKKIYAGVENDYSEIPKKLLNF